jgi:uncharacterized membrane protein
MLAHLAAYAIAAVTFVAVDMVWLSVMAPRYYKPIMGDIAISGVNLPPAIAFYVIYPIGLVIFAIAPALKAGSPAMALWLGALFGFFTYLTYDLTNQATLRNWTTALTVVDVAWGTVLGGVTAAFTAWAASRLVG